MKRLALILVLLALPLAAQQQFVRVDPSPVFTTSGLAPPYGNPAIYAVAGATVQLCSNAACTSNATAYTDGTTATACPVSAPVTLPGTIVCTNATGPTGNFGFWLAAPPGVTTYWWNVTINGQIFGDYPITVVGSLTSFGTPASSSAACTQGQTMFDASYAYFCTATNTWRRVSTSSF